LIGGARGDPLSRNLDDQDLDRGRRIDFAVILDQRSRFGS
jgi:hypothetical protein